MLRVRIHEDSNSGRCGESRTPEKFSAMTGTEATSAVSARSFFCGNSQPQFPEFTDVFSEQTRDLSVPLFHDHAGSNRASPENAAA
jgi:hypothetical protein